MNEQERCPHKRHGWTSINFDDDPLQCRGCWLKRDPKWKRGVPHTGKEVRYSHHSHHGGITVYPSTTRPDCYELGKVIGTHNGKSCGEKLRLCVIHEKCTTGRKVPGVQCCDGCDDYRGPLPGPDIITPAIQSALDDIAGPPFTHTPSEHWPNNPAVIDAHKIAAKRYLESIENYPGDRSGRGVVLCGGGRYAPGIYLHVRLLREFGSNLPVQIWHRGSCEPLPRCVLDLPSVDVIDADEHKQRDEWRILGGWQIKLIAVLHCGWKDVLYSDADNHALANPDSCFDRNPVGGVLWPDIERNDSHLNWKAYGVSPPKPNNGTNGGSALFDLSRCYRAVKLAAWFDAHSDFYYQHGYGDQDTLRAAFIVSGTPFHLYASRPQQIGGCYVQQGPQGPLWAHRIADKPRPKMGWSPRIATVTGNKGIETLVHRILKDYKA